jgi:putative aldouronate transport system substrate-binding protein
MAELNKVLKEKINTGLELKFTGWADWLTKYNLTLASGEPIDLVTTASDWLDLWDNAQKGAFLPLDDLLPKYAPKTWKSIPASHWAECKYNGKIITIPEDQYTQWINHGFFYRGDWAKKFGIGQIKDFATFGKYLDGIKKTMPDVIPYDAAVSIGTEIWDGWVTSNTDALPLEMIPTGYHRVFWTKSYDEKYTAYSPIFTDTFLKYAEMMKEWGDKGYWREDVLNYKGDTRAALRAGKTGADEHHTNTYRYLRVQMDRDQPGSNLQFFAFCDTRNNLLQMSITHGATSIGVHSKYPDRALMVYDLIRNDRQVYMLLNYGIEGVQYVIKNGRIARPEGYNETRDGFWSNFWGGRVDKFELPSEDEYTYVRNVVWKRFNKIAKPYPYGKFVFNRTPVQAELAAISNVTNIYGPAISFGKAGDPKKAVEQYREQLKAAGYDKVLAEIQKQLDAYRELVLKESSQ